MTPAILKRGDYVRVRLENSEEWTEAYAAIASDSNPSSVVLLLNGAVRTRHGGLILNNLPLTIDYDAETATSLFGDNYEIEVEGKPPSA